MRCTIWSKVGLFSNLGPKQALPSSCMHERMTSHMCSDNISSSKVSQPTSLGIHKRRFRFSCKSVKSPRHKQQTPCSWKHPMLLSSSSCCFETLTASRAVHMQIACTTLEMPSQMLQPWHAGPGDMAIGRKTSLQTAIPGSAQALPRTRDTTHDPTTTPC